MKVPRDTDTSWAWTILRLATSGDSARLVRSRNSSSRENLLGARWDGTWNLRPSGARRGSQTAQVRTLGWPTKETYFPEPGFILGCSGPVLAARLSQIPVTRQAQSRRK